MWEVRDAEEGEVHPSVRERERGEWDTAAGLVGLSLRKPAKCKRLADNCLSSVPKYKKRLGREFWQPASCI